ncbi:MAG: tyrosine-protein phosphatase [Ruminococcus sp.]|nr:tyrosine-protein phosphatase [Ruminococcus sp.]
MSFLFLQSGKDRTGVLSAVLLHKSGMPLEYIVNDYME